MRCRRAAVRFELPRAVSRRHDVARSSNLLLRNWKRLEKLLIIGSARSSAPRVAKNVAEGGETVREIVKTKSRRVSGGSRCGGLRASQRGFPSNILSTRPLLGIYHLSSLVWGPMNIPCKGYGACKYTTSRLCQGVTARNKHFQDSIHYFRDMNARNYVVPTFVRTDVQHADGFTKPLARPQFLPWAERFVRP